MLSNQCKRVLNIASHVVHGHVGNCATTFPMQLNGYTVNCINSVQFSNHTGYKNGIKGQVCSGDDVTQLIDGLEANGLLVGYSHMLTGYIGSATFLEAISSIVDRVKAQNPQLKYVCDPVLGDLGKFYVPEELVDLFRTKIIPKSYMITPNQFEAENLSQIAIKDQESALKSIEYLHDLGPSIVIITSTFFDKEFIQLFASQRNEQEGPGSQVIRIDVPKLDQHFTGTGDVLSSMLLTQIDKYPDDFVKAIEISVNVMRGVLLRSIEQPMQGTHEISLVASKDIIENPQMQLKAVQIEK